MINKLTQLIIFLVAVIILVFLSIFLLLNWTKEKRLQPAPVTQIKPDSKEFKTYKNTQEGYAISIPSDWLIKPKLAGTNYNSPSNEQTYQQIMVGKMYGEGYLDDLSIIRYNSIADLTKARNPSVTARSLEEFLNKSEFVIKPYGQNITSNLTKYNTIIGGLGSYEVHYVLTKAGTIYELYFKDSRSENEDYSQRDKIINSFQVIN